MKRLLSWSVLSPLLAIFAILVIWQLAVGIFEIEAWMLPSPVQIIQEGIEIYPRIIDNISTILIALGGFAIGVSVGLVLAVALHLVPRQGKASTTMVLSQNVPIIALAFLCCGSASGHCRDTDHHARLLSSPD